MAVYPINPQHQQPLQHCIDETNKYPAIQATKRKTRLPGNKAYLRSAILSHRSCK
jgi:hypothetical protein